MSSYFLNFTFSIFDLVTFLLDMCVFFYNAHPLLINVTTLSTT